MAKGRHRKATRVEKTVAKATILGVGATAIPLTFMSGSAQAASVDVWEKIAYCESGGRWGMDGGHATSTGGLQIQTPTWIDFGGLQYAPTAGQATKREQILIAEKILNVQGPDAWAVTTDANGAAKGCHGILFRGGPAPYAEPPNNTPPKPKKEKKEKKEDKPEPNRGKGKSNKATYTVVKGDTLYDIAIAHGVGDGGKNTWKPLYNANKNVVENPDLIYPGEVLHIPGGKPDKPEKAKDKEEKSVQYTVREGDTLYYLADYYYGNGNEYPRIFNANDFLKDANTLEVGMKLTIPGTSKDAPPKREVKESRPSQGGRGYSAPLNNPRISQRYWNYNAGYTLDHHTGVDFSAPHGTPVKAVANGVVVSSDTSIAYGINVQIKHDDGTYSLYAHLSDRTVFPGERVEAGRMIGNVGNSGTKVAHLHLEIRKSPRFAAGNFLNPVDYLRDHGVAL